ncbi:hypothetical protein KUL72_34420 [Bradyrhizobium arachidis]|uniref:ribbon-helix-helix protein, CopG family n=1 Tax=Bradyrhizobium TaxID=374 RepID=UPI00188CB56E|nr:MULTISPECIES: ribbon-helix-helix protein, CopG family [Bradyrhizobium]MDN4983363.1 ribbon-helix-helix protein, CopG family [Bradyrhizobium sp. WYCCWR 13022]QOZ56457.1 hypothetical protein XH90_30935 [Bradyrhizobium sp. CCBAU 53338]UVO40680.1 hypothetical protein KUL72_34420 [Bradyrhizobium arachidis]
MHGIIEVPDIISAVKLPERLTAAIDAWARARHLSRSDAIYQLLELGLKLAPAMPASPEITITSDAARIEEIAVHEIEGLLDPALPADERERRIRRLTEGPPEFSHERIDLPKQQT